MADSKNDTGKTPSNQKGTGSESGSGAKISAGTSLGHVGESPMPHSQDSAKQDSTKSAMGASGQGVRSSGGASGDRSSQGASMTEKAQQVASEASDTMRDAAGQARQRAGEAYEAASDWAQDTYDRASHWASDRYRDQQERMGHMRERSAQSFGRARNTVQDYVSENPMVVGLVGLAAGLLLGALLPRTRRENETFGEWADEVRNQGMRYARDATQRGREFVEESFSGEDERFSRHESEFRPDRPNANPH